MNKYIKYSIVSVLILSSGFFIVNKIRSNKAETLRRTELTQPLSSTAQPTNSSPIDSTEEAMQTQTDKHFTGVFRARRTVKLGADVPGRLVVFGLEEGSFVKEGQILAQVDVANFLNQVKVLDLQIEGLQSDQKRNQALAQAQALHAVQLEKTELALRTAQAQRQALLDQIAKAEIRAPFAGVVVAKLSEVGAFAGLGQPLLQLDEVGVLRFRLQVTERDLPKFKEGQKAQITVDALPNLLLTAQVHSLGFQADPAHRFTVEYQVQGSVPANLRPGMFGRLKAL